MKIIIGTRGSRLSLTQTSIIKNKLSKINPNLDIEIKIIKTKGDKNMSPIPLDTVGKGWFTKELDIELLRGNIDIAVHSLKDLPEILPKGLVIAGIPEREDARDVFVSKTGVTLKRLKEGAIVGTDSTRRKTQILYKRPDLEIKSIRGNIETRLSKLESVNYDALILAAAGLKRLNLQSRITQFLDATDFIPSPGQGTLAVVIKQGNRKLQSLVAKINHLPTVIATQAERSFSKEIGGGCKTPTGAFALVKGNILTVTGMIGSVDGKRVLKDSVKGHTRESKVLGKKLAKKLIKNAQLWYVKSEK